MTAPHVQWDAQRVIEFGLRWVDSRIGRISLGEALPDNMADLTAQLDAELDGETDEDHIELTLAVFCAAGSWLSVSHTRRLAVIEAIHLAAAKSFVRSDHSYGGLEKACGLYDWPGTAELREPWRLFSDMDSAMDSAMDDLLSSCDEVMSQEPGDKEMIEVLRGRRNR